MDFVFFQNLHFQFDSLLKLMADGSFLRILTLVQAVLEPIIVLWITWQGYLMVTGQSQNNISDFTFEFAKIGSIVIIAHQLIHKNQDFRQTAENFNNELVSYLTGQPNTTIYTHIDQALLTMQQTINALNSSIPLDQLGLHQMSSSAWMSAIGQGAPLLMLGALLFTCKFALMLSIILAPIFVLSLLFKSTHMFFWSWLRYSLGIVLTWSVLLTVGIIMLNLLGLYSHSVLTVFNSEPSLSSKDGGTSLLNSALLQCLLGLLLALLIISIPKVIFGMFNATFLPAMNRFIQRNIPASFPPMYNPPVNISPTSGSTVISVHPNHTNRVSNHIYQANRNVSMAALPHKETLSKGYRSHSRLNNIHNRTYTSNKPPKEATSNESLKDGTLETKSPKTLTISFELDNRHD